MAGCNFILQINQIKGKVTVVKIISENAKDKNLQTGDIYIGTTENLYLIHKRQFIYAALNIYDEITTISILHKNNFYVTTKKDEIYFMNTNLIARYGHLLVERLLNIKSSNLEKEIRLYYNDNIDEEIIVNNWWQNPNNKLFFKTFNVLKNNLINNYQKIEFLGSQRNFKQTRTSWGSNTAYYADKLLSDFNAQEFKKIITNNNKTLSNWNDNENKFYWLHLQKFNEQWGAAIIEGTQSFALNYYQETDNSNIFLQVLIRQYATCWISSIGGNQFIGIGKGLRLYNDDIIEHKITKRKTKMIKWTDNVLNLINYQKYIPRLINNTSFSTNNVTAIL